MEPMKDEEYKCYECGKEFTKIRTDDEAIAEKNYLYPEIPLDDCETVCDDCFKLYYKQ